MMKQIWIATMLILTTQSFASPDHPMERGEHFATLNGLKFSYSVEGSGPVIIIPSAGWGISVDYLAGLKPLAEHFTVVFFDTRGCGRSERPEAAGAYGFDNLVNDLEALRQHLKVDEVVLGGHSMGTWQAMKYAIDYPDRVKSLLLISGSPNIYDEQWANAREQGLDRIRSEPWFNEVMEADAAVTSAKTDGEFKALISFSAPLYFFGHQDISALRAFLAQPSYNVKAVEALLTAPQFTPELLAQISVPTLAISGSADVVTLPLDAQRLHSLISGSKLFVVERSAHLPWVERSDYFFKVVADNLAYLLGN
jgi:proline iminopeptidase